MDIKDRAFGADIPPEIKQKLALRQELNRSADVNEAINNVETRYGFDSEMNYGTHFKDIDKVNILADLSSRTPFARMWVALQTYTLGDKEDCSIDEAATEGPNLPLCSAEKEKFAVYQSETAPFYFQREIIATTDTQFYQIGNHTLNMLQNMDVNESIDPMTAEGKVPDELAANPFLKPQSGIISISSETMGSLGSLKNVTVNFVVHNFQDFEKIYLPYFLRPGALIFIDYGWSTATLYDPKELDFKDDISNQIMELVEASAGDLDIVTGLVLDYDAKIKENGSVECSVTINSKNSALVEVAFTPALLDELTRLIHTVANEKGDSIRFPGTVTEKEKYIKWGDFEDGVLNKLFGSDFGKEKVYFNSEGSFVRYNLELPKDGAGTKFLYSNTWDTFGTDTGPEIAHPRMPMRELIVHIDLVEPESADNSTASGNSLSTYIDNILTKINTSTADLIKLTQYSNTAAQTTISICDNNYIKVIDAGVEQYFDDLFEFNPMSPNTIVKTYDLSFTMPKDEMQNYTYMSGAGPYGNFFPVHSRMDSTLGTISVQNLISGFVSYLPQLDQENGPVAPTVGEDKGGPVARAKNEIFNKETSPILPLTLTLSIYGISTLAPGDVFKVNYLPSVLRANTFFQITSISHDISTSTWTTTIESQQRYLYSSKSDSSTYKGKEYIGDGDSGDVEQSHDPAIVGEVANIAAPKSLCSQLQKLCQPCTAENLTAEAVEKFESVAHQECITINYFGKCRGRDDYPAFKKKINETAKFEADVPGKKFHYIYKTPTYVQDFGIYLLDKAIYDCDVRIWGAYDNFGCDFSSGISNTGYPCKFMGYGYNKRVEELSGGMFTVGEWNTYGVAKIVKGASYYAIHNRTSQPINRMLAPQENFNPIDYDFNVDHRLHADAAFSWCDYGWGSTYPNQQCAEFSWDDWKTETEIARVEVELGQKNTDSGEDPNDEKNDPATDPQWCHFTSAYEYYLDTQIFEWIPKFDKHSYFIDCNPKSDCYHKAFAIHKKDTSGKAYLIDQVTGQVSSKTVGRKRSQAGKRKIEIIPKVTATVNGIASVTSQPYCITRTISEKTLFKGMQLKDIDPEIPESENENFGYFCNEFKKYGTNVP